MLTEASLLLGNDDEEILPIDKSRFPYLCKYRSAEKGNISVTWHWHTAFAISCLMKGDLEFQTTDGVYQLHAGEAIFINSNVMHRFYGETVQEYELYSHVFEMPFLSGQYGSLWEERYFQPVARNRQFKMYIIRPDSHAHIRMLELLMRAVETARNEPPGYEFDLRALLSEFWKLLFYETEDLRARMPRINVADSERIRTMMQFIQEHYDQTLTLQQIASSANISVRECSRCFERTIETSPMQYLREYRLRVAVQRLIKTKKSITQIALECGFSSGGYFSKVFYDAMGCSPRTYRTNRWENLDQTREEAEGRSK